LRRYVQRGKRPLEDMRPMKVCMVAYSFYDTDNRVRRYAESLVRRGYEVDALAIGVPGQPHVEMISGVRLIRMQSRVRNEGGPFSYLSKMLQFFFRTAWFLTLSQFREPYSLIHVHNLPDFEVFATLVPRLMGTRVILDMHEITPEFYASKFGIGEKSLIYRLLVLVERLSIAYVDSVIVVNHMVERAVLGRRSVKPEKCMVVLNYPDRRIFPGSRNGSKAREGFTLCYPGTLNRHQGVDIAVEAVALAREKAPGLRFLIFGDGAERENLERQICQRKLDDIVTMKGTVTLEQVARAMETVDAGVVPKRGEGFGSIAFSTKIMEFMAMGVPVIASRTPIDEFYFNDELLEFFEPGNAQDLARKIVHLMETPERAAALRQAEDEFICGNNWDVKQHEYFGLVDKLAGPQDSGGTEQRVEPVA
jgi:glycosyltransferase involved in cell wall biosynthesis